MNELNKKPAWFTLIVFLIACTTIISIHSFPLGFGLKFGMTISKYVGLALWSVITFIITNLIAMVSWIKYAREVFEKLKMSKAWFAMAVIATVCLVLLSFCPIDFYDAVPGEYGVVSIIHMVSSRTMFVLMIITAIGLLVRVKNRNFRIFSTIYVVCGIFMAILFAMGCAWFWSLGLLFESMFIFGYLVMLCAIPKQVE